MEKSVPKKTSSAVTQSSIEQVVELPTAASYTTNESISESVAEKLAEEGSVYNPLSGRMMPAGSVSSLTKQPIVYDSLMMFYEIYKEIHPSTKKRLVLPHDHSLAPTFVTQFSVTNKASHVISQAYQVVTSTGVIPPAWVPYIDIIKVVLRIAKLWTPPHIDTMIDKILFIIESFQNSNARFPKSKSRSN